MISYFTNMQAKMSGVVKEYLSELSIYFFIVLDSCLGYFPGKKLDIALHVFNKSSELV